MRFSDAYSIQPDPNADWFDPDLTVDTKLFVDPFLLLKAGVAWQSAHAELVAHFAHCYQLVARAAGPQSLYAKAAHRLLTFPEPYEFGLGYSVGSTRGAGGSLGNARSIADGIAVAVAAGLQAPDHIEEIGILNEGFGADRISDATLNILKRHFVAYTQGIAEQLAVPLHAHKLRNAGVDLANARWLDEFHDLPTNPRTGSPVLLVPKRLMRDLPTLNAEDWFQSDVNEEVRTSLNLQIGETIPKREIVRLARRHPERVREWARNQTSRQDLKGYDFGQDPKGVVGYDEAADFAELHPLPPLGAPDSQGDLSTLVAHVLEMFKLFIEQQGGWRLLWNGDGSEKNEEAAQLLFMAMARHYLRLFGVEVDREVELGRGPVDFKVTGGHSIRLLIEVKKVHNGRFWNGLNDQLPSYLASDGTSEGWFVAIRYRSAKSSHNRLRALPGVVKDAAARTGKELHFMTIDGTRPPSASNIKETPSPGVEHPG